MAIQKFKTNNLVKEHDLYVDFLKKRQNYFEEYDGDFKTLFPRRGKRGCLRGCGYNNSQYWSIRKWHCIVLTYDIWYDCVKDCRTIGHTPYKLMVNVPINILKNFKNKVERAIKEANCDYNAYHPNQTKWDACRYLAVFWTYLDIVKDTKTQRFFPTTATRTRMADVFNYGPDVDPVIMNGVFWHEDEEEETGVMNEPMTNNFDTTLEEMNFTVRTYNCLRRYRMTNYGEDRYCSRLGDILKMTQKDLLRVRNLGMRSLREIMEKIKEYGYEYPEDKNALPKPIKKEESVVDIAEQVVNDMSEYPTYKDIATISQIDGLKEENGELRTLIKKLEAEKKDTQSEYEKLQQELFKAKDHVASLESTIRKLTIAQAAEDDDIFGLITNTVRMMKVKKMDWLYLTLDGMTIDIHGKADVEGHPRMSYTIRTREE